jgi:uncharacterized protein YukE
MTYEQAWQAAKRTWDPVYSVNRHESGAWEVRLHAPNGPVHLLPDGDSGITPANAWTDDPKYRPQQVIPAGLEKRCVEPFCHGVLLPVPGTDDWDADGTAGIRTRCEMCGIESCASWYWPAGEPPATDPDYYGDDADDEQPARAATFDDEVEVIRHGFEYELCATCGKDLDEHDIVADLFGHAQAVCRQPAEDDAEAAVWPSTTLNGNTNSKETMTMNLEATGPEEIRAAFTAAIETASERSEEISGIAGVLTEAADRYESLDMAGSTVGHLRDAGEAFAAAQASLTTAMEELQAALADFNAKDGQVAEAVADAGGNVASKEVLVG